MMYASRIEVKYEPQKVRYQREVELPDGLLTLEDIGKHLKDGEKFGFFQREEGGLGLPVDYISIHGYRLETEEEVKVRVAKAEKYNENYEKFNAKYRK
jgi:hypothetical protein